MLLIGVYNIIACLTGLTDNQYVDMGNYLYMLVVTAPIFITSRNYKKIMCLNGTRMDFYWGALINYIIISSFVSLLNIMLYKVADIMFGPRLIIWNLVEIFGWYNHGIIIAFLQQFSFLILVAIFVHSLSIIQGSWYGWLTDILLIAIISTFIPINTLRNLLLIFLNIIIFQSNAYMQITSCLILTVGIYVLNLLVLKKRRYD